MASLPGDADSVVKAVALHPSRFVGFFMFDPTRDDAMAYASARPDAGLRTICLFPAMHRYALHDDRVARVFELASSSGYQRASPTRRGLSTEALAEVEAPALRRPSCLRPLRRAVGRACARSSACQARSTSGSAIRWTFTASP